MRRASLTLALSPRHPSPSPSTATLLRASFSTHSTSTPAAPSSQPSTACSPPPPPPLPPLPPARPSGFLVCIDGSHHSDVALRSTFRLLRPWDHLYLLSVPPVIELPNGLQPFLPALERQRDERLRLMVSERRGWCEAQGLRPQQYTAVVAQEALGPREAILRFSRQSGVDYVVVGAMGGGSERMTHIDRFHLGGVAQYLAHHCSCSVIVVK